MGPVPRWPDRSGTPNGTSEHFTGARISDTKRVDHERTKRVDHEAGDEPEVQPHSRALVQGRAALAGARDKADAEKRIVRRANRRRRTVLAVLAIAVVTAVTFVGGRWLYQRATAPDLSVGSSHDVTMETYTEAPPTCAPAWVFSGFDYGGIHWQLLSPTPTSWGRRPVRGRLTITAKAPAPLNGLPPSANGRFFYHGSSVQMFGSTKFMETTGPIC